MHLKLFNNPLTWLDDDSWSLGWLRCTNYACN